MSPETPDCDGTSVRSPRQRRMERGRFDQRTDPMQIGGRPTDGTPEHLTATTGRRNQAEQHADGGGLACTVRADEPRHPTFGQVEVDRVDGSEVAEVLGQAAVRIDAMCLSSHLDLRLV